MTEHQIEGVVMSRTQYDQAITAQDIKPGMVQIRIDHASVTLTPTLARIFSRQIARAANRAISHAVQAEAAKEMK